VTGQLFHIALPDDWERARDEGMYTTSTRGVSLAEEGFVHCSRRHQVEATANRFYADLDEVVVLTIDEAALDALVVDEDLHGAGEPFPHVYGPIPVATVVEAARWTRGPTGEFRLD
jgi:glutathione S-transferase